MKILIIGNTGFIGKYLTRKLIDTGYEVVGMDVNPRPPKQNSYPFVLGNILNPHHIMKAASGVDMIINLAAKHHDFGISRGEFFEVNVKGTLNILECASKLDIKKFIFYSTVAVYGESKTYTTENTPLNPSTDYGQSKLAAEKTVHKWALEDPSRQAAIIRPTVVFGPDNFANVYNLIDSIYKRRFVFVGNGSNIKSVAYVENLVDATVFILENLKPGMEIYNYSDYPEMTTAHIVETISNCLSRNVPRFRVPLKLAVTTASIFDLLAKFSGYNFPITANRIKKFNTLTYHTSEKIRKSGFQPRISVNDGFKRMIDWYVDNKKNDSPTTFL